MQDKKNWYTVYTKPRWEKKVHQLLEDGGLTSYCPLNKVRRKWSDRYKIVNEPLFKSYVFVQVGEQQLTQVRMVQGVLNFVYWNGKPAVVRDEEINTIKLFLRDHDNVLAEKIELNVNQHVRITSGVLMDEEAVVVRSDKHTAEVLLKNLGYRLIARIDKSSLRPV